jgi:peptidoglycan/LPS O-acetylase OafA/YrhL
VFTYHLDLQLFSAELFGAATLFIRRGYLGVDGFFILSGFVLAYAHPTMGFSPPELWGFWRRRLARIYPVHVATICLLVLLLAVGWMAGQIPRDPARFSPIALAGNLLLVHGWGETVVGTWNYPSWTISTEWAGYLAFPLLWFVVRRLRTGALFVVLAAALAALAWAEAEGGIMRLNLTYRAGFARFVPEFVAGMALARLIPVLVAELAGWRSLSALVGIGLAIVALVASGRTDTSMVLVLFAVLAGFAVRAGQGGAPILARMPGFVYLGTISYSFYMSFAVVEMIQAVAWRRLAIPPADHPLAFALSTVAATFALAWMLLKCVEQPGHRRLRLAARPARG